MRKMEKARAISSVCYSEVVSHHYSHLDRHSKTGREVGNLYSRIKGRLQVCLDWMLLAQGSWSQAN